MKMTKIEKKFVNSKRHAQKNIELIDQLFIKVDLSNVNKVLEIGCGVGVVSAHLNMNYKMDVVGTDLDQEQIKIAKIYNKMNENLKFIKADAIKLPFENNKFEIILSLWVMHHINDWERALKEINRVLKPKGFLIFSDLAYSKILLSVGNMVNSIRIFNPIVKNYGFYTINDIIYFLKNNNFEIIYKEKPKGVILKNYTIVFQKN